jgi:hypothetical protein
MSIKVDKNPGSKEDWHTYKVNFVAVDGENGKEIEVRMMEDKDLSLYGLMTLKDAAEIHEKLGEKLKEFGEYKTEIVKNLVMKKITESKKPVRLTTIEEELQKQGITKITTFVAVAELYMNDKKIKEVIIDKRYTAYEPAKRS